MITLGRTASLLQFSWEVFNHPPYSPDLAPSDSHLFLHLKKFHQRFENDREEEMVVTQWFQSQAPGSLLRHRYSEVGPTV
jgi:hypothetical protein